MPTAPNPELKGPKSAKHKWWGTRLEIQLDGTPGVKRELSRVLRVPTESGSGISHGTSDGVEAGIHVVFDAVWRPHVLAGARGAPRGRS